ncbi:pilus assembly protein CpaA [Aestuariivirga litoralis]|uniref:Pilus assembly protein CpaA n=1 Tax=Aestuariivirga litoralis TaxID=2650924 RepID=A0A2W2BES9_9HYPH|nr:prepilin peptidase [Aestuariivirga litoralis]PZF78718.1 pilus assembly protein CpaA [Aestuariivirga litoralis]
MLLFPLIMVLAAARDVMTRRIPNRLVILSVVAFFPLALIAGMPWWLVLVHGATAASLFVAGLVLFALGILGAGDGKLMAAAGLWLGFPASILFIGLTAISGALLAAAMALFVLLELEVSARSSAAGDAFRQLSPKVPYGFALAAGAILATPFSWMMRAAGG